MSTPEHLKYSATHQWAQREADGTVSVGITDHAQEQLGDVVFVDNPAPGRSLRQGEVCGAIESVKAASDIYAPVSGEVIAVNADQEPYAAWMFRVKPADPAELDALLDAAAYRKIADAEKA
jgi:glycine cleavage system H protein